MPKLSPNTRWAVAAMAASLLGIILVAISVSAASFLPNTHDPTRPEISWTAGSPPTFYTLNPWRWPLFIAGTGLLLAGIVANIMLLRTLRRDTPADQPADADTPPTPPRRATKILRRGVLALTYLWLVMAIINTVGGITMLTIGSYESQRAVEQSAISSAHRGPDGLPDRLPDRIPERPERFTDTPAWEHIKKVTYNSMAYSTLVLLVAASVGLPLYALSMFRPVQTKRWLRGCYYLTAVLGAGAALYIAGGLIRDPVGDVIRNHYPLQEVYSYMAMVSLPFILIVILYTISFIVLVLGAQLSHRRAQRKQAARADTSTNDSTPAVTQAPATTPPKPRKRKS